MDNTCKRCATIPWEYLLEPGADGAVFGPVFANRYEDCHKSLRNSSCRICNMLSRIRWVHFAGMLKFASVDPGNRFVGKIYFSLLEDPFGASKEDSENCLWISEGAAEVDQSSQLTTPSLDLSLAVRWMKECEELHGSSCTPSDPSCLKDLRVIDCETRMVNFAPRRCDYLALSYVWGSSVDEGSNPFPTLPENLPRTIEDALKVTLQLGYRYLWIDRYCIDQGDAGDKHSQILQMGRIYGSARLTLVAAVGHDPHNGFPGVSISRDLLQPRSLNIGAVTLTSRSVSTGLDVVSSDWAHRAWTFQEGYLSKRRLFFTDDMISYVCGEAITTDEAPEYNIPWTGNGWIFEGFLPQFRRFETESSQSPRKRNIETIISAYSAQALTYDNDALKAFLGIFQRIEQIDGSPIYHMWGVAVIPVKEHSKSYEVLLNWHHNPSARATRRLGFPSWSSFGWNLRVDVFMPHVQTPEAFGINIQCSEENISLEDYVQSGLIQQNSGFDTAPHRLNITGGLVIPLGITLVGNKVFVIVELTNDTNVHLPVYWDDDSQARSGSTKYVGLVTVIGDWGAMFMVLREGTEVECYERIGFVCWDMIVARDFELERIIVDRISGEHLADDRRLHDCLTQESIFQHGRRRDLVLV